MPHDSELLDEALDTQLRLLRLWEASGSRLAGWKIGFTTGDPRSPGDNRDQFPASYRPFGFLLQHRVLPSGATIERSSIRSPQLEPELYMRIGEAISGDVSVEQARSAVSEVGPAFEINERRYVSSGTPLPVRIAGGLSNWGIVAGVGVSPPGWDLRTTEVTVTRDGDQVATTVYPPGGFDDPYVSLTRLCARLGRFDRHLRPGDYVITGAFSHHAIVGNHLWEAAFSGIGAVEIGFSD